MDDNCRDCIHAAGLEERLKQLDIEVKVCNTNFDKRIHELEKHTAVSEEKFKQISEKLDKIVSILDKSAERIPSLVWGVAGAIIAGVMMWALKI